MEAVMIAGRLGRMGIVAGMHVAAFYMIATSLGIIHTEQPPTTEGYFVPEAPRPDDPMPTPDPVIEPPPARTLFVEPEPVPFEQDSNAGITGEFVPLDELPPPTGGSARVEPSIPVTAPRLDARRPLSQPPYPARDIRLGNEGNADVEVYVLPNGRVGDARIARSTGFESMDRSAIEEAKRSWRLIPATRDGVPIAQWYKVRVTFKLTNQ
jgi:periplasmic protein TonB